MTLHHALRRSRCEQKSICDCFSKAATEQAKQAKHDTSCSEQLRLLIMSACFTVFVISALEYLASRDTIILSNKTSLMRLRAARVGDRLISF